MSNSTETDFDLELHFLPAWAQKPAAENQYADYKGGRESSEGRDEGRRPRPPRRHDLPSRGPRPSGPRGPRPDGPRRAGDQRGEGKRGPRDRGPQRGGRERERERREPPPPLIEINCAFIPDDKGVESLARQIKMTGRAYPLFEIAQMILQKPERHSVTLSVRKNAEGQVAQPLVQCALDDTVWTSEDEAVNHVLSRHFTTFYQAERTPTDPPKGVYTFVAQCGMSGAILGPPNYHDYQNQLRKLHSERFSRMPFEVFKARVKIVKDPEVVKKWVEEQSFKTEYICLNVPEPLKLPNRDEVEKHFRQVHLPNIIKQVETAHLTGSASRGVRSQPLARLIRQTWEDQKRFPLQLATVLSQKFAAHGLQFFKVNKTVTHVAVARPRYLDMEATPVSESIKKIVEFIAAHPKCPRRALLEALAPGSQPPPQAAAPAADTPPAPEPSPEYTAVISDLHWLVHQGHVIEFANGTLELAKKPIIRPPKPTAEAPAAGAGETVENPLATAELGEVTTPTPETAPSEAVGSAAPVEAASSDAVELSATADSEIGGAPTAPEDQRVEKTPDESGAAEAPKGSVSEQPTP